MNIKLLLVLFLMVVVAVFSVQNAGVVTVRFLNWQFALSQALVILLAVCCGAIVGLVAGAMGKRKPPERTEAPPPPPSPAP